MSQLDIVLLWHMHQPAYRTADGIYHQPWVYLHAIKDYADIAWHLERSDGARAVVNFTPILLEQLRDYVEQFEDGVFRDPLLRALQTGDADAPERRAQLAYALLRANVERMVRRFPEYDRLYALAHAAAGGGAPLSDQDRADALVWYHLAWLGEGSRRTDARVQRLMEKASDYDAADREALLGILAELVCGIVPRYRALADAGRIELSTCPYSHPMVPLLIDFRAALEAQPDAHLPDVRGYPGGADRVEMQLRAGKELHVREFGAAPTGCWPPEGGVSDRALAAFAANGFAWAASGEGVLAHSLHASADAGARPNGRPRTDYLYTPYAVHTESGTIACFFRDDDLSDRIGFVYATWHADDAAANLIDALEKIADATANQKARQVTIILDGENAWEHYPENAYWFLSALYDRLTANPKVRLTTFADHLRANPAPPTLERIVAGSWVYGTFATWIGDHDKNRAWDLLVAAKQTYDRVIASGRLDATKQARAEMQLRACEGSDWFWWFGGYNPALTVSDFERLFRRHLRDLYAMLGEPAPAALDVVVSAGSGAASDDGVMRRAKEADQT